MHEGISELPQRDGYCGLVSCWQEKGLFVIVGSPKGSSSKYPSSVGITNRSCGISANLPHDLRYESVVIVCNELRAMAHSGRC